MLTTHRPERNQVVAAYVAVVYRYVLVGSRQTELRGAPIPAR